jgi:hypothetical protein
MRTAHAQTRKAEHLQAASGLESRRAARLRALELVRSGVEASATTTPAPPEPPAEQQHNAEDQTPAILSAGPAVTRDRAQDREEAADAPGKEAVRAYKDALAEVRGNLVTRTNVKSLRTILGRALGGSFIR